MLGSKISDKHDKAEIIRKGNELFNKGDIILAYKCYCMADYSAGIEKIADHFFYNEKNPAKAIVLYKKISSKNDGSNMGGNIRVKQKLEYVALKIVEIIRQWNKEDDIAINQKREVSLDEKKKYLLTLVDKQKNKFHTRENS